MTDDAFGNYISGFTDGEGCFDLNLNYNKRTNKWYRICRFKISMRDDDSDILQQIMEYWGCGSICNIDRQKDGWGNQAYYAVGDYNGLHNVLVPHFDRYPLRAKKLRDYEIWRKAVVLSYGIKQRNLNAGFVNKTVWTQDELDQFDKWQVELRNIRKYKTT